MIHKACEWIQKEEARLEFIRKHASKETIEMLKSIYVGDTLFWTTQSKELKLAEKPTEFSQIARIKCQRSDGKIIEVPAGSLRKLSKGNYSGEYLIKGVENGKRAQDLENKAKYHGFRAEIMKKNSGYLLKIYGDSQQKVDEFVTLFVEIGRKNVERKVEFTEKEYQEIYEIFIDISKSQNIPKFEEFKINIDKFIELTLDAFVGGMGSNFEAFEKWVEYIGSRVIATDYFNAVDRWHAYT